MALSDLLISHGDTDPSGENLEYDPAFISLELAAQPGEERQVGDSIIQAEEPDHAEVIIQATDVLSRSHDLRAAAFIAYALLRTKGFVGFAQATGYIRGILETYWDTCHPQLDADDDDDPTMRVNAVAALADADTILRGIRLTPLTDSRAFGRITLRDIAVAEGEAAAPSGADSVLDVSAISAAFQDTDPERLQQLRDAAEAAYADVKAIGAVFDDKIPGFGPDLDSLEKLLRQVLARFNAAGISGDEATEPESDFDDSPERTSGPAPSGATAGGGSGAINSQNDVRSAIDRIISYYARQEPSSPLPILLERAKRLVGADFMTIIRDMAPDGRDNVKLIGGLGDDDDDDD